MCVFLSGIIAAAALITGCVMLFFCQYLCCDILILAPVTWVSRWRVFQTIECVSPSHHQLSSRVRKGKQTEPLSRVLGGDEGEMRAPTYRDESNDWKRASVKTVRTLWRVKVGWSIRGR